MTSQDTAVVKVAIVVIVEILLLTVGVVAYAEISDDPDPVFVGAGDIASC